MISIINRGISINGIHYKKVKVNKEKFQKPFTWLIFKLKEGKNREIRNICKFCKWDIVKLIRIQYGPIKLSNQKIGEIQEVKKFSTHVMLNIIGGFNKKAKLDIPTKNVRPTSSKKRESIFSILESNALKNNINIYYNKYFLDLFAGSGSLGLEAISRGAKFCYFYEIDNEVIQILNNNCLKICNNNEFKIVKQDITKSFFTEIDKPISVIFIDPPYALVSFKSILANLLKTKLLLNETIIVIETEKNTIIESLFLQLKL